MAVCYLQMFILVLLQTSRMKINTKQEPHFYDATTIQEHKIGTTSVSIFDPIAPEITCRVRFKKLWQVQKESHRCGIHRNILVFIYWHSRNPE